MGRAMSSDPRNNLDSETCQEVKDVLAEYAIQKAIVKNATEQEWEQALDKHLEKYYKHRGAIKDIKVGINAFGNPMFRTVIFENGSYVMFCKMRIKIAWFRHSWGRKVKE